MALNARPFWKILMITAEHDAYVTLNCDECFLILEFLAEEAIHGMEERRLVQAVHMHLDRCPECREHHLQRLREIEARLYTLEGGTIPEEETGVNGEGK